LRSSSGGRNVSAIKVQEVEGVIDEPHPRARRRSPLGVCKAWQSRVVGTAEFVFALMLASAARTPGYLSLQTGPSQELHAATIDALEGLIAWRIGNQKQLETRARRALPG
jgi:hypothetical protein